jgi:hypothetical protein
MISPTNFSIGMPDARDSLSASTNLSTFHSFDPQIDRLPADAAKSGYCGRAAGDFHGGRDHVDLVRLATFRRNADLFSTHWSDSRHRPGAVMGPDARVCSSFTIDVAADEGSPFRQGKSNPRAPSHRFKDFSEISPHVPYS